MKTNKTLRQLLGIVLAVCLVFALASVSLAATTNQAVLNDKSGVLHVNLVYTDAAGKQALVQTGSGFLVNDTYLITCNHVVTLSDDDFAEVAAYFGVSTTELSQRLSITVSILRDMSVTATVRHQTEELDYAILELSRPIYDRTFLPIRESSEVSATENCFALGFPAIQNLLQDVNSYTFDDVAVSAGKVNKIVGIGSVDYVQTNASTSGGSSGGPLVDEDGNVIGICNAGLDANNFFAIASSQLTPALKSLGIEYTPSGSIVVPTESPDQTDNPNSTPAPVDKSALNTAIANAKDLDTANYTDESLDVFDDALKAAEDVAANSNATQEQVDAAATALKNAVRDLEENSSGFPMWAIIAIAAAVALAIIIAIILIAASNKKKKAVPAAAARPAAPVPPVPPAAGSFTPPAASPAYQKNGPGTTVLNSGAGETTVLSAGGNETTVLSQNLGSLTRKKNRETIQITKPNFRIGKERSSVDYCISDNTAVSRVHVILVNRGGQMYAADQRSTNGTFVNNVRVDSGKEVRLNAGDKLTLGDEEFVFNS